MKINRLALKGFSLTLAFGLSGPISRSYADFSDQQPMSIDALRAEAFARCQAPYQAPVFVSVPMLDPPADGDEDDTGMVYEEDLAVRTTNLLDQNQFYFSPRPRGGVDSIPIDIFVDATGSGVYQRKTWDDANPDYSSSTIQPPINKSSIPAAGRVLTELIVGHRSPKGDYPQLFDFRSSAYLRFSGFPPSVTGASMRLGAHGIFDLGAPGTGETEDFPVLRAIFASANDPLQAHAFVLLENKLFCGALSLDMSPATDHADIVVDSFWYTREDFHWQADPNTALVAYSSMFLRRQTPPPAAGGDAAHDSDTMIVKYSDGSQITTPLNPPQSGLQVNDLSAPPKPIALPLTPHPVGWTLANEDRIASHYTYFTETLGDTNYDKRASYNVTILGGNVQTGVSLYQNATNVEYGDNIVAASTLRQDVPKAKSAAEFIEFKYKTTAFYPPSAREAAPRGPDQCEFIRQAIAALPATGGTVAIPAGVFACQDKIVVKKSGVQLRGAGEDQTTLSLADQFAAPVLVIGDDKVVQDANGDWVTATRVTDVTVSDLTVDGNLANEDVTHECGEGSCDGDVQSIRNNAITVRGASRVAVTRVTAHSAISGGLVTEKYCDHLTVSDFTSYGNHFDGFAGYQTTDSLFEDVNLSRNRGAGISIDIDFDNNHFEGGTLASNGDVGIFARNLKGNLFENLAITGSGNHGAFLADSGSPNTCANSNEFRSVTIEDSKGYGIDISSACTGNQVTGVSILQGNSQGCYSVNPSTTLAVGSQVTCK